MNHKKELLRSLWVGFLFGVKGLGHATAQTLRSSNVVRRKAS